MKYSMTWRNKFLTVKAETIDDMIQSLESAVARLKAMRDDGVILVEGGTEQDYAFLVTTDFVTAQKYGFEETDI